MTSRFGSRRLQGPGDTYPVEFSNNQRLTRSVNPPSAPRPLFIRTRVISQANGSAYVEQGQGLKVMAAVYGPRESSRHAHELQSDACILNCHVRYLPFACRSGRRIPLGGGPSAAAAVKEEREMSSILQQALSPAIRLELYPKSSLDIYVYILERDGQFACLAAAVNAASVALAQAGIDLIDMVAATTAGFIAPPLSLPSLEDGIIEATQTPISTASKMKLDLGEDEEKDEGLVAQLFVSYMPTFRELTHVKHVGQLDYKLLNQTVDTLLQGCEQISSVMKSVLIEQ